MKLGAVYDKGCVRLLRWALAMLNQQVIQSCLSLALQVTSEFSQFPDVHPSQSLIMQVLFCCYEEVFTGSFCREHDINIKSHSIQYYNPNLTFDLLLMYVKHVRSPWAFAK